jgi:hypothetical protein
MAVHYYTLLFIGCNVIFATLLMDISSVRDLTM